MEVPQQVNPFQNVLNPSLLFKSFIQISSESYPPKEFEGKRKGKSGKDETSRIILQVNSIFWGKKWEGKKQRSLSAVNSIFSKKKSRGTKNKKRKQIKRGVVKLRAFIHNLLRENSFRKKNSPPVSSHRQFVYAIEIILTMKSTFLLFRINILKRKVFRKNIDIVQSLDFLWKTKNNVFQENISGKKGGNHFFCCFFDWW